MAPRHFWWLVEAAQEAERATKPGASLTQDDRRDLLALLKDAKNRKP